MCEGISPTRSVCADAEPVGVLLANTVVNAVVPPEPPPVPETTRNALSL